MNVMFDINVVLDILARREPFFEDACAAFVKTVGESGWPFLSAHAYTTIYYILGGASTRERREAAMKCLFESFTPAGVTARELKRARELNFPDFEDAVVVAAAESAGCSLVVTRNKQDFPNSPVRAVTPREFRDLSLLSSGSHI